jgi:hypothetical protein
LKSMQYDSDAEFSVSLVRVHRLSTRQKSQMARRHRKLFQREIQFISELYKYAASNVADLKTSTGNEFGRLTAEIQTPHAKSLLTSFVEGC